MKRFTFFPLASFYVKYVGLFFVLAGITLFLWLDPRFQVAVYLGLFLLVFSRERTEDELTARYRAESFKTAFGLTMVLWIALHLTEWISPGYEVTLIPFLYMGVPLLIYLLIFYLSSLLNLEAESAQGVWENIRNNRKFYLIWTMFTAVVAVVMIWKITRAVP